MRRHAVILLALVAALSVYAAPPAAEFDLGMRAFRAGDYASAVVDLQAAASGFEGDAARAASYQSALVYLALAHFRLGQEEAARDTILRLVASEEATPTYATLPLERDAADFEALVAALVPTANLPRNASVAAATIEEEEAAPLPVIRRAPVEPETTTTPVETTTTPTEPASTTPTTTTVAPPASTPTTTTDVPSTTQAADAAAEVRVEEVQADADRRIAAIQAEADRRVAAAQADADARIAAIQAEADRRIAAAQEAGRQRVAAAEEAARQRVAAAELEAQRTADARIAAIEQNTRDRIAGMQTTPPEPAQTATAPRTTTSPRTPVDTTPRPAVSGAAALTALRQADAYATSGDFDAAHAQYERIALDPNAERQALAEAAVGLYRVGSYRESAAAFRRLGVFAQGEEDLRYYYAVALYETGDYRTAQKELSCALPFIEMTDDVARYRMKIEQSVAVTLTRNPTLP